MVRFGSILLVAVFMSVLLPLLAQTQAAEPDSASAQDTATALVEAQQVMRQRRYAEATALLEPHLASDDTAPSTQALILYARACLLSFQARRAMRDLEPWCAQWETDPRLRRQVALCEYAIAADDGLLFKCGVPESVAAAFCVAEKEYPVDDPEIAKVVSRFRPRVASDAALARAAYDFVRLRTRYDKSLIPLGRQDVLFTLHTGRAVCTGFAQLYVTLCRAAGVPARLVAGRGRYGFHNWAEVWLVGKGWVPVDPTRGRNRSAFGILDRDIHPYDSQRENW
ncbi:MAG: transglutaminase-like domain-containing protein [Armatimonadota bacterium]